MSEHFEHEPTSQTFLQQFSTWKPVILESFHQDLKMGTICLQSSCNFFTDMEFKLSGPQLPSFKVVVVLAPKTGPGASVDQPHCDDMAAL